MWDTITESLKNELGKISYNTWFKPIKPEKLDDTGLTLIVPSIFYKEHIETHYVGLLNKIIKNILKKEIIIDFIIKSNNGADTIKEEKPQKYPSSFFNPKFSFDNFIVGSGNTFAHAVCLAVSNSPGTAYNPLFLYSKVGLGKTHLMQAIGHYVQENSPEKSILYISGEKFTNELIDALQNKTIENFRNKYRNLDVLLIDDIQFIAQKERTQEEFFHTFNHLHNVNKQIVISSDKPPKELYEYELEERLISRFEWGISADIQAPDIETRIAILRKKATKMLLPVPDNVVEFIARNFTSNIRELEGALTKVVAFSSLQDNNVTLDVAKNTLKDSLFLREKIITIAFIQKYIAEHFELSIADLKSSKRNKTLVYPRQLAMYLSRKITNSSFPEIGNKFGGRDHSTVIHSYDKIQKQIENDNMIKNMMLKFEEKILQNN